jgi:hypothetical protein
MDDFILIHEETPLLEAVRDFEQFRSLQAEKGPEATEVAATEGERPNGTLYITVILTSRLFNGRFALASLFHFLGAY